jgi:3-methyladenine DNA glycosylase AlkD
MTSVKATPDIRVVRKTLREMARPGKIGILSSFFKTGPGQYGEGDRFLGVTVPDTRRVLRLARGLPDREVNELLSSQWHEERLLGVLILVERAQRSDKNERQSILDFYLRRLDAINNWDLVDASAHLVVGPAIQGDDGNLTVSGRKLLKKLSQSERLWDRRVAVLATFHFIRQARFEPILMLAKELLRDPHDLIHKAIGWMLREAGKRDVSVLRGFLANHSADMPRTMLRYAIERLPDGEKKRWMKAGR